MNDGIKIEEMLSLHSLESGLRREAARVADSIAARISVGGLDRVVKLQGFSPEGVVCMSSQVLQPGCLVGLRLDDSKRKYSHLYQASVTKCLRKNEGYELHFHLTSLPIVLHWGRGRAEAVEAVVEVEQCLSAA